MLTLDLPGETTSSVEVEHFMAKEYIIVHGKNRLTNTSIPESTILAELGFVDQRGVSLSYDPYEVIDGVFSIGLMVHEQVGIKLKAKVSDK